MKLDYTVKKFAKPEKKLKNKTKLSMQSTVTGALLSKLPAPPSAQPVSTVSNNNGWSRSV